MKKIFTLFAALTMVLSMFAATETVYFVNAHEWTGTINAYAWTNNPNASWPGVAATKEAEKIAGFDVYSYTAEAGTYANVIFNNGSGQQTTDLKWTAGKYYCKDGWYTKEEAAAKLGQPVEYESVYFVDNQGWGKANIYTWTPEVGTWPGVAMTKEAEQLAGYDVYSYTVEKGTSFGGVIFNNGSNQTANLVWTAGKYYVKNGWYTKEEAVEQLSGPVAPPVISYVLMGVAGDWTTGIALTANPENANEYVLLDQTISEGDAVKVVTLTDGAKTAYCGNVDEYSVEHSADKDGNIVLAPGTYDFYYKVAENLVYIGAAEPEYMVVEDVITNFVFDTEAWPMVCMGGPSTGYQIEVFLTLTEDADGTLAYEDCSVSLMGTDATFIDGTLSNIDPAAPYADAVLHVQWDGDYYELQLAMSSTPAEPITIEAEDATVTLTEYPTNFEGTEFAYELTMVANWVNEAESLPYTVDFVIPTFDPTKASGEYNANFVVTGEGDAAGLNENVSVTVTKDGNNVTLTGNVSALNGNAYNVTISGTLPADEPEVITWELNGGELVVEVPTQEELWASFQTAAGLNLGTLDNLNAPALNTISGNLNAGNLNKVFAEQEWQWLKTYVKTTQDAQVGGSFVDGNGTTRTVQALVDEITDGTNVINWRYAVAAFFVQSQYVGYPAASADFTEAGKPEAWGAAYQAAHAVVLPTEPVAEDYVLPTPVKTGYTFVGWYDNEEGTGEAYTVIPAGWSGTLYAIWKQSPATALENIAVEGKAVKAIVNGQLIIIKNGVQYNAQGAVIK